MEHVAGSFADRAAAGHALAPLVAELRLADPVVLALPRGGVPVAAQVAAVLNAPLEVYVTRKIGAPYQPEFGVGAVAEDGEPRYDGETLRRLGFAPADLAPIAERERAEVTRRIERYRRGRPLPPLRGRDVVLVDDGLATGVTARAAVRALRREEPRTLVLAVPVCAPVTADLLRREADHVVCALAPPYLGAVGQFYADFSPTTDAEVIEVLDRARTATEV